MKLSRELNDALEAVSKEVDSWPAWKRSIDLNARKKATDPENHKSSNKNAAGSRKTPHITRAAKA